ncbi:hypothetical protein [Methylomonas rhizoryzae]|uniref:hypothetical protein n=1 Tax=Methylomonas rhizoryzae TaxID=2608981 RepID=UPI001232DE3A|nr:hypothetical protein [Methylomonas rhizoryzae]
MCRLTKIIETKSVIVRDYSTHLPILPQREHVGVVVSGVVAACLVDPEGKRVPYRFATRGTIINAFEGPTFEPILSSRVLYASRSEIAKLPDYWPAIQRLTLAEYQALTAFVLATSGQSVTDKALFIVNRLCDAFETAGLPRNHVLQTLLRRYRHSGLTTLLVDAIGCERETFSRLRPELAKALQ